MGGVFLMFFLLGMGLVGGEGSDWMPVWLHWFVRGEFWSFT